MKKNYNDEYVGSTAANDYTIKKFNNPDTKAALKYLSQIKAFQPLADFVFSSLRNDKRINNPNPQHEIIKFINELRPPDSTNAQEPASSAQSSAQPQPPKITSNAAPASISTSATKTALANAIAPPSYIKTTSEQRSDRIAAFQKSLNYQHLGGFSDLTGNYVRGGTSDHAWKTFSSEFNDGSGNSFYVKVGTWNLMDLCASASRDAAKKITRPGNNPLDVSEFRVPQDYISRKTAQFDEMAREIKAGTFGSAMALQEVDFLSARAFMADPSKAPHHLIPKATACAAFQEMLDANGWTMISTDLSYLTS